MIGKLISPITQLLDKFIPDADAKAKLAHEVATMAENHALEIAKGQMAINQVEAASASAYKSGWRPFIGWVCGISFGYHFVLQPLIIFSVAVAGLEIPALPAFDMGSLMTVMMGMLGLGAMRTYEKKNNVHRDK